MGEAYHQKHDEESALKYLMLALEIKEKQIGCMNSNIAITYNNLGSVYWKLKQYDNAIKYTKKSLNIYKKIYKRKAPQFCFGNVKFSKHICRYG
ncbi:MAG: tetratricopeptide repeat protein [Ruminococcus sp.]